MNARTGFLVVRWLVRDTFRQTLADGVALLALLVTLAAVVGCLSVTIEPAGRTASVQRVTALFGLVEFPVAGDRPAAVRALHASLAGLFADTVGVLLLLLWTASVLPGFLAPSSISVLLAKPVPRWSLIVGKCLGVLAFVAVQAFLFVAGTAGALAWSSWLGGSLPALSALGPDTVFRVLQLFRHARGGERATRLPACSEPSSSGCYAGQ